MELQIICAQSITNIFKTNLRTWNADSENF